MAELIVKKHAPSGTIILNRPRKRNALSRRLMSELRQALEDFHLEKSVLELMLRFPKPIIAALNGPAVAGGAGLALAADLVVATPEARFGFPEAKRGLVAGLVTPLIVFRLGAGTAARLLFRADLIEAEEALRLGAYHELVKSDLIWARAHQLVGECAEAAPQSLQLTKQLLNETIGEHMLETLLAAGAAASATSRTTEAAREGLEAFLQKRKPNWQ
jgi:enoyl-CoA hydratase/carnithine racemase